jgi:hypothetical protein
MHTEHRHSVPKPYTVSGEKEAAGIGRGSRNRIASLTFSKTRANISDGCVPTIARPKATPSDWLSPQMADRPLKPHVFALSSPLIVEQIVSTSSCTL